MILKKWGLTLLALVFTAPLSASALGISIVDVRSTGSSLTLLDGGDIITFDLVVNNDLNEHIFGIDIVIDGYVQGLPQRTFDNRLIFVGGQSISSLFSTGFSAGPPPVSFGGLVNQYGPGVPERFGHSAFPPPRKVALLFGGLDIMGTAANTDLDIGIGGNLIAGGVGDVHMQVSFRTQELQFAGDVTLEFGTETGEGIYYAVGFAPDDDEPTVGVSIIGSWRL